MIHNPWQDLRSVQLSKSGTLLGHFIPNNNRGKLPSLWGPCLFNLIKGSLHDGYSTPESVTRYDGDISS